VGCTYSIPLQIEGIRVHGRLCAPHAHVVITAREGFLTADKAAAGQTDLAHVSVYMCGPPPMTKALVDGFRRLGVPRAHLRWEEFAPR